MAVTRRACRHYDVQDSRRLRSGTLVMVSSFSKLQNIPELKVGHAKIFNFSPKTYKLSNSISRDSGDSPDSNYAKYVNYGYEIREKIPIISP
jgi:hypothetical protein